MCGLKVIGYAMDCVWIYTLINFPIGFMKSKKKIWNQHIMYTIQVIYGGGPKECNDFDPLFQRHLLLNAIDLFCNLTPSSSSMDMAFWFEGYFHEAVSISKCATFPSASRLEAAGIFSADSVPLNQLCWQKHNWWKGRQYEWNRGIHYATLWHYPNDSRHVYTAR